LRLVDDVRPGPEADGLVESYRRLADVFHEILADQRLDTLLDRIADTLGELVPHGARRATSRRR
jgi:hypothetical protein